jgi:hypothetical protein
LHWTVVRVFVAVYSGGAEMDLIGGFRPSPRAAWEGSVQACVLSGVAGRRVGLAGAVWADLVGIWWVAS